MGDGFKTTVQRLAVPLIVSGLVVGILLGLLLGWVVWPVQWYDTDPSDLRLQHQADYAILAADSLAVTGDIEAAAQRLAELTDGDTTWHQVADLVERVAAESESQGDLAAALRLRRMAQATGLPLATSTDFSPRSGADGSSTLLYVVAAVVLVGIGVAGYLYRMRLAPAHASSRAVTRAAPRASARASTPASWLDRAAPATSSGAPGVPSSTLDLQGEEDVDILDEDDVLLDDEGDDLDDLIDEGELDEDWEDEESSLEVAVSVDVQVEDEDDDPVAAKEPVTVVHPGNGDAFLGDAADDDGKDDWEDDDALDADTGAELPAPEPSAAPMAAPERMERGVTVVDADRPSAVLGATSDDIPPDALGVFEAEYILGDDDFDASFTIESPDGEFLGECGVGLTDVLDVESGVQRADAFEVWLFDKGDIRTVTKVLVSEQAFRDEARSARLSAKGDLVIAQPGLEVTLETLSLRVTVTLRDCEFAEGSDGPEGYFVRLDLELLAESSDAVP